MGTEIKSWQIVDGKLQPSISTLAEAGRTEPYDLEPWIESNPEIVGAGIAVIGRQVSTKSGPIDRRYCRHWSTGVDEVRTD